MVAMKSHYHKKCLVEFYARSRQQPITNQPEEKTPHTEAFSEIVRKVSDYKKSNFDCKVFKLSDIKKEYQARLQELGVRTEEQSTHSTRFKDKLLASIPGFCAHAIGREVLLVFEHHIAQVLSESLDGKQDCKMKSLARAAEIVREDMFNNSDPFNGAFSQACQQRSVPPSLLTLVNMILEGTNDKSHELGNQQAALSIAQLLKFNSGKRERKSTDGSVRHCRNQETPLPLYLGVLMHVKTRKKELVEKLCALGLSVSYDRVLRLSSDLGNAVCERYEQNGTVCPPNLRGQVFITAIVDNIDHNTSSTNATGSFHGTSISVIQHPSNSEEGHDMEQIILRESSSEKCIKPLPASYTSVPSVVSKSDNPPESPVSESMMVRNQGNIADVISKEVEWLEEINKKCSAGNNEVESRSMNASEVREKTTKGQSKDRNKTAEAISWSAFHAERHTEVAPKCTSSLLPLFSDCAHSEAMISHAITVISKAVEYLNPGQTVVIACDQPLFA